MHVLTIMYFAFTCHDFILITPSLFTLKIKRCQDNDVLMTQNEQNYIYIPFILRRRRLFVLFKQPLRPPLEDILVTYSTTSRNVDVPSNAEAQSPASPLSDCPVEYIRMFDDHKTIKMSPPALVQYLKDRRNEETLLKELGVLMSNRTKCHSVISHIVKDLRVVLVLLSYCHGTKCMFL